MPTVVPHVTKRPVLRALAVARAVQSDRTIQATSTEYPNSPICTQGLPRFLFLAINKEVQWKLAQKP